MVDARDIAEVRSFNRLVTSQLGVLQQRYLGRRPLGECRVLFEIGADGATPRDVRARLGLDSGYLSRLIRSLEREGLVASRPDPRDARTKRLTLTEPGREELAALNAASDAIAASALEPLTEPQRARLLAAQADVRRLLAVSMTTIAPEPATSPDARWCLGHYFDELAARFEGGFDHTKTLPADAPDVFLVARLQGQPAGCGALKGGEILRMWVDPAHRGLGIASRLLDALETAARERGHTTVRLYTNRALAEAQRMYRARGYTEVERFNADPYADHFFEKRLIPIVSR